MITKRLLPCMRLQDDLDHRDNGHNDDDDQNDDDDFNDGGNDYCLVCATDPPRRGRLWGCQPSLGKFSLSNIHIFSSFLFSIVVFTQILSI